MSTPDLYSRLLEHWTPAAIERWLDRPHPQLNGQTARSVIAAGREAEIHEILDRLEDGAYL